VKALPLIIAAWKFWIPQRVITFAFIPERFYILFGNICSFAWNVFLVLKLQTVGKQGGEL